MQIHTVRACGGQEALLTTSIQGGERLASLPGCFIPVERAPEPTEQKVGWDLQLLYSSVSRPRFREKLWNKKINMLKCRENFQSFRESLANFCPAIGNT